MIRTFFGLAQEGKTNENGMPNLLQLAVISQEFGDVFRVKSPPIWFQRLFFGLLAPIGGLMGYKATYPHHKLPGESVAVEPWPEGFEIPTV